MLTDIETFLLAVVPIVGGVILAVGALVWVYRFVARRFGIGSSVGSL